MRVGGLPEVNVALTPAFRHIDKGVEESDSTIHAR
jgi:hypothetical protein